MAKKSRKKEARKKELLDRGYLECYYCDALVKPNALRCPRCGKWYSSGKIIFATVVTVAIIAILGSQFFVTQNSPRTHDFDFEDWNIEGEITMPEKAPDLRGQVVENYGQDSFVIQSMVDRQTMGDYVNVNIDDNTDIFWMNKGDMSVVKGTIDDVQPGSLVMVWGSQNSDGSWHATDVGLVQRG